MGGDSCRLRKKIEVLLKDCGATAVGFAKASEISEEEKLRYADWLAKKGHAGMDYLKRHHMLRHNPGNLLEGCATVIMAAFSYVPKEWRDESLPYISCYAYGEDYHIVLRERIYPVISLLKEEYGGEWRLCIDSAPLPERYWALQAGLGVRGVNGSVIVDGCGGLCFLASILTTLNVSDVEGDTTENDNCRECSRCMKCVEACPTGALNGDGTIDSANCINYLTIEHKGEWNEEQTVLMKLAGETLFGCDRCLKVCPHNIGLKHTAIEEFHPHEVSRKRSPLKRSKLR